MKIFITGGTGNIGQYVSKALLAAGHSLVAYTRTPERIPAFAAQTNVAMVQGDILELERMKAALAGCDAVIHIALGWGNTPVEMLANDTRVTAYLIEEAERAGVRTFVYTSSTAAVGNMTDDGMDETAPCKPTDLYGATKAASESYLLGFRQFYSGQGERSGKVTMRRNIIRPGYTFSNPAYEGGASQSDIRFRDIARAVLKGENMMLSPNDGTQFLSSEQIAEVYVRLVESELNEESFFALGSRFTSWVEIAQMALACVPDSKSKIIVPEGEELRAPWLYDVGKIKRVFGLSFDATEALREHVRWNVERERCVLAGEAVHDVYHVW
ncbi:MAG: NAD(P)-dependent oxidoreductase [Clostridia bacterium]|nr:NAD(P)-dependent oxidoreductase [Clostridia bacterium]